MGGSSRPFFGWYVVFACFWIAVFGWGFGFYGHAVYLAELQQLHGWPAGLIGGATTAYYLVGAALLAAFSAAADRLGMRPVLLAGLAAMAASVASLPFVTAIWQLYAAYLLMAVGWATMSITAITTILAPWFLRRRGLAIALALTGASFGGILVVPALVHLEGRYGFRAAMLAMAAAMLLLLVPMVLLLIRERPQAMGLLPDGDVAAGPAREGGDAARRVSRAALLRDRGFWSVAAPFALALMAQVGFIVHQIAVLEPAIGRERAGLAVALTTFAAVAGRIGLGFVVDRLDQRTTSAASLASQAAALLVIARADDAAVLYLACILFGLSVGNLITLPALIVQREFDAAAFGAVIGLVTGIGQVTYAFGPGLLGVVRDLAGGYGAALALCILLQIAAAVGLLAGRRTAVPAAEPE